MFDIISIYSINDIFRLYRNASVNSIFLKKINTFVKSKKYYLTEIHFAGQQITASPKKPSLRPRTSTSTSWRRKKRWKKRWWRRGTWKLNPGVIFLAGCRFLRLLYSFVIICFELFSKQRYICYRLLSFDDIGFSHPGFATERDSWPFPFRC